MLFIVSALHCEARPFIEYFSLKKDSGSLPFDTFSSDDCCLIISGIGRVRSAMAVASLLSGKTGLNEMALLNIGICGSADSKKQVGEAFFINQVVDTQTGRKYFPDCIVKTLLKESDLHTFDAPVSKATQTVTSLVDMEGAGFCQAASMFLSTHQFGCVKIVSDHLSADIPSKSFVEELIRDNLKQITELFDGYKSLIKSLLAHPLTKEELTILAQVMKHLKLTDYQRSLLKNDYMAFRVRTGRDISIVHDLLRSEPPTSKDQSKRAFNELRSTLVK